MILLKRTISISMGKGVINHNIRAYKTDNVDGERTHRNISYCNESIRKVYHELFDEALKKYNAKQTRKDRIIKNYYKHICGSNQEKPFYEAVVQVGNKEDMSAISDNAELSKQIMDEYFSGFKERNPHLRVFSAHLHLDEAKPHLHIDFVPFTTGSKRGLETRVSLKQALAAQGFKGGSRGDTEWNQWVESEKLVLAKVMERHGVEWEQLGTHNEHLSVLDFKKQERVKEIEQLESKLADKKDEFKSVENRIRNYNKGTQAIAELEQRIETDSEYQLPEPQGLMSAKSYKQKFVEPLIKKFKAVIRQVFVQYFQAKDDYYRLNTNNGNLYRENERLTKKNEILVGENENLRAEVKDYKLLRKVLGSKQIDSLLEQARSNQREKRFRNTKYER